MRLYEISRCDIEAALARPMLKIDGKRGNPRITGCDESGRAIIVVIAGDDSEFVITTFPGD